MEQVQVLNAVQMTHSGDVMIVQIAQGTSAGNHGMIQFRDGGGTYCGQITSHGTNHTGTSYVQYKFRL